MGKKGEISKRKQATIVVATRDDKGNRVLTFKGLWKKAGKPDSLKSFARNCLSQDVFTGASKVAKDWLHNKSANTSKPNLGIGHTRGKKKKK